MRGQRTSSRRRWLYGCGTAGLAGLAGCIDDSGLETDDDGSDDDSSDPAFPPGLSADGLEDSDALLEAHRMTVAAASFTGEFRRRRSMGGDEREDPIDSTEIRADPAGDRVEKTTRKGPEGREEAAVYIDGDRGAARGSGSVGRQTADEVVDDFFETIEGWMLEAIDEYDGTQTIASGTVHEYGVSDPDTRVVPGDVDGDGTILIDEDGRIHRYRTTMTNEDGDFDLEVEISAEFSGFGETTVDEPEWVDDLVPIGQHEVSVEPGARIELEARTSSWVGVAPSGVEGIENPTLVLEAGGSYEIGWARGDGAAHNVQIRDESDDVVDDLSTSVTHEPAGDQWLEFEASEEIAAYACDPHQNTMYGEIVVR